MINLSAEIERLLKLIELDAVWQVVASLTNALGTIFTIRNDAGLKVQFILFSDILFSDDDDAKIARIRAAIAKAKSSP